VKDKLHEKGLKASSRDFGAQRFRWFSLSLSLSLFLCLSLLSVPLVLNSALGNAENGTPGLFAGR